MKEIGKGDWLQCIRTTLWNGDGVVENCVYCVEEVVSGPFAECCTICSGVTGLRLVGICLQDCLIFCPCLFRPLGGDHEQAPVSVRVCEPA